MTNRKLNPDLIIVAIIVLVFMVLSFLNAPFTERMESTIYSVCGYFTAPDDINADKIILIDIDEKSINDLGPWPWPKKIIADMINRLDESEVKVIGLNLPLNAKDDNTGLREINNFIEKYRAYPPAGNDPDLKKWVLNGLSEISKRLNNDKILSDSIKQAGNVILPLIGTFDASLPPVDKNDMNYISKSFLQSAGVSLSLHEHHAVNNIIYPYQELIKEAAGFGHVNLETDRTLPDNSHLVFLSYSGSLAPSLSLMLAISYYDQKPEQVIVENDRIILKDMTLPLIKGRMLTRNKNFEDIFTRFSFSDLLKDQKSLSTFKNKVAIIGIKGSVDSFIYSPAVEKTSGSLLIAGVLKDIINQRVLSRPDFIFYLELAALVILNLLLLFLFDLRGQSLRFLGALFILILTLAGSVSFLLFMDIWFKSIYILCSVVTVYIYLSVRAVFTTDTMGRESRETTRLLGLNFQSQGLLDLAFDKFKKLTLDKETKDLIYNLGLEYEKKGLTSRALTAYEYINKGGGFKDLNERIKNLKSPDDYSAHEDYEVTEIPIIVPDSRGKLPAMVGRYEIISELGKGSMGLVYKAQDPKINRLVAIKTIRFSDEFDEDVIHEIKERFFREAEIAGKLTHPAIVTVHDVGSDGDLTYMAMEYLVGEDLDKYIKRGRLLPVRKVLEIVKEIAEALDFAHKADVIHRDIKPANVMLLENGRVKVTDFGIAKAISSSRTKTGVILGTPNYMSPEQIMGQKIDSRSDIFSLGVLFYQLLTGELPFYGDNLSGLLYQITQVKHPSPRSYNPKIPKICEQILDKAMAKNPDIRFKSAGDIARIIGALVSKIDQIREKKAS